MTTATGFDFELLSDGSVLIEFFGDNGQVVNKQIVIPDVIRHMSVVAALTDLMLKKPRTVLAEIIERFSQRHSKMEEIPK